MVLSHREHDIVRSGKFRPYKCILVPKLEDDDSYLRTSRVALMILALPTLISRPMTGENTIAAESESFEKTGLQTKLDDDAEK
jgi:hypothetical protein